MNRAYWETVAADYDNSVLSVFDHDIAGAVQARIEAAADPSARAADLGCGVGKFTPALARCFGHVEACDLSARGVAETRERCRDLDNVTVRRIDLARTPLPFAPVDLVLCVNVLIMPALDARRRTWRAVANQVDHGGRLVLVVPSVESAHFDRFCDLERDLDDGCTCAEALGRARPGDSGRDLGQGVFRLRGLRTKHYLREELEWLLSAHEFDVDEITKLEFAASPAPAAGADIPGIHATFWDWLVVARRR
ncbi:MAG: class I SAM-dependent methyltransferase [Opitutaceae bacterium]|nr:class I SAM-dependent methyltransferase [Opitutaceae bacterium]